MLPMVHRGADDAGFFVHAVQSGGADAILEQTPDNILPPSGAYLCFIPVLDFWRLSAEFCADQRVPHFATSLEPRLLADARAGRALLVFDLSNEGPPFDQYLFDCLHEFLDSAHIPAHRTLLLTQNRVMERDYRAHYDGKRESLVSFDCYDFFVKTTAVAFADPAMESLLGANGQAHVDRLFDPALKDRLLLCMNATPRPHRVLTVAALIYHDWLDQSLVSFPGLNYQKDPSKMEWVLQYLVDHPAWEYLRDSCAAVGAMPALRVDDFEEVGNMLVDKIDPRPYHRTFFSLVTETELSNGNIVRITEKSVKAYALGHPAYILGNPGATELLTSLGFEPFTGVIDPGYERIEAAVDRFNRVFEEVGRQIDRIRMNPQGWLAQTAATSAANVRHALSGGLLRAYVRQYDQPVLSRMSQRLNGHAAHQNSV